MSFSIRKKVVLGFAISVLALAGLGWLAFRTTSRLTGTLEWIEHAREVIATLDEGHAALAEAVAAVGTLAGSGLFETVVLDLAGVPEAERRLPGATWIRLQRTVEDAPTALVLLADRHVACGPGGVSLALAPAGPRWSGASGPGRLLSGLRARATAGRHVLRRTDLLLRTLA